MGGFWIFAAVALVVLSAPLNSPPLLLTGTLVLLLALLSRWWARYSLVNVEYRHWLSSYRIFVGEDVLLGGGIGMGDVKRAVFIGLMG